MVCYCFLSTYWPNDIQQRMLWTNTSWQQQLLLIVRRSWLLPWMALHWALPQLLLAFAILFMALLRRSFCTKTNFVLFAMFCFEHLFKGIVFNLFFLSLCGCIRRVAVPYFLSVLMCVVLMMSNGMKAIMLCDYKDIFGVCIHSRRILRALSFSVWVCSRLHFVFLYLYRAYLQCPFVALGQTPEGGSSMTFPRLFGKSRAAESTS